MTTRVIEVKWSAFQGKSNLNPDSIPEKSGVYEYWVELKDEGKDRLYIGKADNLRKRYNEHIGENEKNECLKTNLSKYVCYYRYALIPNATDMADAELGLYKAHTYECSKVEPSGSGKGNFTIKES